MVVLCCLNFSPQCIFLPMRVCLCVCVCIKYSVSEHSSLFPSPLSSPCPSHHKFQDLRLFNLSHTSINSTLPFSIIIPPSFHFSMTTYTLSFPPFLPSFLLSFFPSFTYIHLLPRDYTSQFLRHAHPPAATNVRRGVRLNGS